MLLHQPVSSRLTVTNLRSKISHQITSPSSSLSPSWFTIQLEILRYFQNSTAHLFSPSPSQRLRAADANLPTPTTTTQTNHCRAWGARVPPFGTNDQRLSVTFPSLSIFRKSLKTHFFKMTNNHEWIISHLWVVIFVCALLHPLILLSVFEYLEKHPISPIKHYRQSNWFEKKNISSGALAALGKIIRWNTWCTFVCSLESKLFH